MKDATWAWAQVPFGEAQLVGDTTRHLGTEGLEHAFERVEDSFETGGGSLAAIVLRCPDGRREQPLAATLSQSGGLLGDRWSVGKAMPGDQVSMMNVEVAARIANGQSIALFGDNLFTDLDLRTSALPEGSQLRIGEAVLEVSATPHVPCDRFRSRFGHAAFRLAANASRVRGVYLTVLVGGAIAVGDPVRSA